MQNKNILIIGGGASGLMCALTCVLNNKSVCVLESGFKVGKKILVSGNGRCNLTNKNILKNCYNNYPEQLNVFNSTKTLELFSSLGLETYFDEEGRCYPISNHSKSVLDVILNKLDNPLCEIITNCEVINIEKVGDHFIVKTSNETFKANKVVLATGGNSVLPILKSLSIPHKTFKPSLCGLKTTQNLKQLNGIRVNAKVSLLKGNKVEHSEVGEVLFKEDGLSGICIFNISAKMNWLNLENAKVVVNLFPDLTFEELTKKLKTRVNNLSNYATHKFFDGMLQPALANEIFLRTKINTNKLVKSLLDENLAQLAKTLQNLEFNVCGTQNNFQVHSGGIELSSVTKTLECKTVKNLFFCGEILDVDGMCGGYNLQWAWTSGHIVGENLWLKLKI